MFFTHLTYFCNLGILSSVRAFRCMRVFPFVYLDPTRIIITPNIHIYINNVHLRTNFSTPTSPFLYLLQSLTVYSPKSRSIESDGARKCSEKGKKKKFRATHTCLIRGILSHPCRNLARIRNRGGIRPLGVRTARGIFRGALVKADRRHDVRD